MKIKNRVLNMLIIGVLMLVIAAITAGLGGKVTADIGSGATAGSALANATAYGGQGINTISSYLPTIGTVIAIVVVLGLLLTELYGRVKGAL